MGARLDADVIIAGAGPAGAAAAFHLARAGLRVILLDQETFPRDKVCGDFVSSVALGELAALGVTKWREYTKTNIVRDAAVFLDGQHLLTSAIPRGNGLRSLGRVIPRQDLDNWIVGQAHKAGAELRENHRVIGYRAQRHYVEVIVQHCQRDRNLRGHVLIGADGSASILAATVRGKAVHDDRIIAVRGYFKGLKGPLDRADLYFSRESFPGYCWLFPTGAGMANVGVGMVLKSVPRATDQLRPLLIKLIANDSALKARLAGAQLVGRIVGWPLTTFNPRLPVVGDRILLAGDAAGLINPLNGEGIQYALLSGRWVAETVIACALRSQFSKVNLEGYSSRLETELAYDLGIARILFQLIRNRALNPLWLEALHAIVSQASVDPEYALVTGGILAGVIPTRRVFDLGIVWKTLGRIALHLARSASADLTFRPADLQRSAVRATGAAVGVFEPMLRSRLDTESWGAELAESVFDLASTARTSMNASLPKQTRPRRGKQSA